MKAVKIEKSGWTYLTAFATSELIKYKVYFIYAFNQFLLLAEISHISQSAEIR